MSSLYLNKVLSIHKDLNSSIDTQKKYMNWVVQYIEIMHPDFITVFDVQSNNPIVYQKNFHLKFPEGSAETVEEIRGAVLINQSQKILIVDTMVSEFFYENEVVPKKLTFSMRYNTELIPGIVRTFLKSLTIIESDKNGKPKFVLVSVRDITKLYGDNQFITVDIKNYGELDFELDLKLKEFKQKLDEVVASEINLTKREKSILELISQGKTSKQIADILNIAINTVNTHRQNLIKKNSVKNTTALLRLNN